MTGQGGEALELALGLVRAPALRSALRRRPLPDGIGEVLAIASESSEATREASARTGLAAAELVEASRFYVQQVLLADGADAYRNLGATPDADHAVLRDHHRLLLRWLHPDRSREGAQWESALSTRVNQAWNQLRTPVARARYDAEQAEAGVPAAGPAPVGEAAVPAGIPLATYRKLDAPEPVPTGPIAVAVLAIACLALAWLAWTREGRLDGMRDASRFQLPRVDVSERMAAPLPHVLPEVDVRAPAPAPVVRVPATMSAPPPATAETALPAPIPFESSVGAATAAIELATEPEHGQAAVAAVAVPAEAAPTRSVPARSAPTEATSDPLQLFHEAEAAIGNVTSWFAAASGHEPLWLDPAAASGGNSARDGLRARQEVDAHTRMAVDQPNWTLGAVTASMSGAYRLQGRRGTLETGVLHVRLARRGDQWRVAGLQLEPAQ